MFDTLHLSNKDVDKLRQQIAEAYQYLKYNNDRVSIEGRVRTTSQLGKLYNKLIKISPFFIDLADIATVNEHDERERASLVLVAFQHIEYRSKADFNKMIDEFKLNAHRVTAPKKTGIETLMDSVKKMI